MSNQNHENALDEGIKYSAQQFDKSILFIASGAFIVSFAFIKDLINLKEACSIDQLINSWYIFACTIFISLVTHFISLKAHNYAFKNNHLETKKFNKKIAPWNRTIDFLNILMIISILIGAYFLINFININLK